MRNGFDMLVSPDRTCVPCALHYHATPLRGEKEAKEERKVGICCVAETGHMWKLQKSSLARALK
jgi:hypothetical protein